MQCLTLIDTGCSGSMVDVDQCQSWKREQVDIIMINDRSLVCCQVRVIICIDKNDFAQVDVLVVCYKPLAFYLLLGIDIKSLGGTAIESMRSMQFRNGESGNVRPSPTINLISQLSLTIRDESRSWYRYGQIIRCLKDFTDQKGQQARISHVYRQWRKAGNFQRFNSSDGCRIKPR